MLRIQMMGLAAVAALVMSAVAAGSAFAAHEWLVGGASLASPVKIHSEASLELEDAKATLGAVRVSCAGHDAGTVGPNALDLVESITLELLGTKTKIGCTFIKNGACNSGVEPTAEAVNLPWHTELYLEGTEVRDMITENGTGGTHLPGWAVTCKTALGNITDTCTVALGSTGVEQMAEGVLAKFEKKSPKANCSNGGTGAGLVEGNDLLLNPGGSLLSFD